MQQRHRLDYAIGVEKISFCTFLLIAHRAAHQPLKRENRELKFRTDLWDQVMRGWLVTQYMIVYEEILFKKSSNRKSKLVCLVLVSGHYMSFKHHISFATNLAANFGCYRLRIIPDIVSKHLRATI